MENGTRTRMAKHFVASIRDKRVCKNKKKRRENQLPQFTRLVWERTTMRAHANVHVMKSNTTGTHLASIACSSSGSSSSGDLPNGSNGGSVGEPLSPTSLDAGAGVDTTYVFPASRTGGEGVDTSLLLLASSWSDASSDILLSNDTRSDWIESVLSKELKSTCNHRKHGDFNKAENSAPPCWQQQISNFF